MSASLIAPVNNNPADFAPVVTQNPVVTALPPPIQGSVGYAGDVGWTVPTTQLVRVISSLDKTNGDGVNVVVGVMSKPFSLSTSSEWKSFIGPLPDAINEIGQFLTGGKVSGASIYSSRRIWTGSEPLSLSLTLQFYAVYNAYNEVVSPVIRLQRMALPSYVGTNLSLLTPPGPSPYSSLTDPNPSGDIINIFVGGFLYFPTVIIKRVTAEFDSKYDQNGYPLGATVQIEFQTYQVTTKDDISKMVYQQPLAQPQPQVSQSPSAPTTIAGKGAVQGSGVTTVSPPQVGR